MYSMKKFALRLTVPLALVLVVVSSLLIVLRVEQVLLDFAQARNLRAAHQLTALIESGIELGITLPDQASIANWLKRQIGQSDGMVAGRVQNELGAVAARVGNDGAFDGLNPVWTQQLLGQGPYAAAPSSSMARSAASLSYVGAPVSDTSGRRVGVVWLAYDRTGVRLAAWSALQALWPVALLVGLALVLMLGGIATAWMRIEHRRLVAADRALAADSDDARSRDPIEIVRRVDGAPGAGRRRVWNEALLVIALFALTFSALSVLAWRARDVARPLMVAQIDANARMVLQQVEDHIERALSLGIPIDSLVGVGDMFQSELESATEMAFLSLQTEGGQLVAFTAREADKSRLVPAAQSALEQGAQAAGFRIAFQPLELRGERVGQVVTGTPIAYVDQRLRSILLDLLFAAIVSLVLVRELLGTLWERSQLKPYLQFEAAWQGWRARALSRRAPMEPAQRLDWWMQVQNGVRRLLDEVTQNAQRSPLAGTGRELVRIRLIVFLTALSDELLRPFFTVFTSEAQPLSIPLSPTMMAGLPVAAFMFTLAIAQPLGPWITKRFEMRRALFTVALAGAMLILATAQSNDAAALILLRAGSGACYGLMLILSQTTIVRITDYGQRARGLTQVAAAIVAAGVCGPPLGGLLVERLGTGPAFAACAACLASSLAIILSLAPLPKDARANLAGLGGWRGMAAVLRQPRVMAVTLFAAVPARLVAAAVLVVVTPLYMLELGETSAASGRIQLLYFLAFMITAPWVARWSDLSRRRGRWIVLGCALSALSCASLPLLGGTTGLAVCCALLGIGQALLSSPQLALVTETFDTDPQATQVVGATPEQALAAFRFIERFGSIAAPFAVAMAVAQFGLTGAVAAIGVLLTAGTAGVGMVLFKSRGRSQAK
jgi:MFS family permease